jgi:preprotein translocase subunit YajC
MFDLLVLFANVPAAAPANDGGGNMMFFFIMLFVILIVMWMLMVNPQKKQEERLRKMLNSIEKNDRVMTVGGLIGTVHSIDKEQNEIVLKVDDTNNTRIRFHLTAVSTVFPKEGNGSK